MLLLSLCSALAASPALAATATGVLTVQATVVSACSVAGSTFAFGTINPANGTSTLPSVNLSVTCTMGTTFAVGLGDGVNAAGGQRRMKGTGQAQYLSYELYRDVTGTQRFGDSVTSQRVTGQTGLGAAPNLIAVYGAIPSGQSAPSDVYSDTVPITVYY
jgi:spore coat protein U-like protein